MAHGAAVTRVLAGIFAAATVAGCGSVAHNSAPSASKRAADLRGSPPLLAALHRQADQLLGGGRTAFEARLHALRGVPVVVTQWSSTCEPCQLEFPYFQQLSAALGRHVAFIGVDASDDSTGGAKSWLRRFPVSFPSYRDSGMSIALALSVPFADDTPVTYLFTRTGTEYFHVGYYTSEHNLRQEIRHYLGV
jgi:cytochrome c biogenesis protein CcmG, thiol:disulfide interchange protein DsbE